MSQPTPAPLLKAKLKTVGVAAAALATTAALTFGATTVASEVVLADRIETTSSTTQLTQEQIDLLASIGIYPTGPGAQIARFFGAGTPQGALNTLGTIAGLIPGETGDSIKNVLQTIADFLEDAQNGIDIGPIHLALPEVAVPKLGPAGTYDAVAGLKPDVLTQGALGVVKTLLPLLEPAGLGIPLNVPGTDWFDIAFESDANRLAIIPTWGLGGTNAAITSPYFLNDDAFKETAVLILALRNTSRPGGGLVALLNPLSSLVGINLSNVDGTGTPETVYEGWPVQIPVGTEYDGNVTVWDITAAYDILSDAPSTILNPVSWANSAVGAVMPTYLIPESIEQITSAIESGDIGAILGLLLSGGLVDLKTEGGLGGPDSADGNLYITYNSGNLPLLEPFQFLPRTISYLNGFDISTPFSESFNDVLTQLVAMGYQDVNLQGGSAGQIPSFVRGWDQAGTQAEFWKNPVNFEQGLQVPQALLNALIGNGSTTGITGNLLNPSAQELKLFGSTAVGDLVYDNAVTVAVAGFLKDALQQLQDALNPIFDQVDSNSTVVSIAKELDRATGQVNDLLRQGGDAIRDLDINLSDPLMEGNRVFNDITGDWNLGGLAEAADNANILTVAGRAAAPEALDSTSPNSISMVSGRAAAPEALVELTQTPADEKQGDQPPPDPDVQDALSVEAPAGKQTDLLRDNALGKSAKAIANELKSQSADVQAGVKKQTIKTENSLTKRSKKLNGIGSSLSNGDVGDAAKGAGNFVKDRVERLGKDIKNGVDKVTGKDNGSNSGSNNSGSSSGGNNSGGDKQ